MNTKQTILVTLLGTTLALAVTISNRIQDNGTGGLEIQPTIAATTQPTIAPQTSEPEWLCPNESQIKLTPMGQSDPVCVYKMGTIGNQIRTELHESYTQFRKLLKKEGKSPQEIEQELYKNDLDIMERIQYRLEHGTEKPAHPDTI
jgi:hypothetical protein